MTTKKYTLIPSMSMYNTDPNYEMYSEHPANSKKWCAQVMEIQNETGIHYRWYLAHRNWAEIKPITAWRFNWN